MTNEVSQAKVNMKTADESQNGGDCDSQLSAIRKEALGQAELVRVRQQHRCSSKVNKYLYTATHMFLYLTIMKRLSTSSAFICSKPSSMRRPPFFTKSIDMESISKRHLPKLHPISPLTTSNIYGCTSIHERRKTVTPERVEPLKRKQKAASVRRKRAKEATFQFESNESEAFLSTIAVAAEMDDTVASIYSTKSTRSNRLKGRPSSVSGAMNKSTLMSNIEAEAVADEVVASGMVSRRSKQKLIELAQERKKELDKKKYYEEYVEDKKNTPRLFYEKIEESQESAPPTVSPPLNEPKRRGRPRKDAGHGKILSPSVSPSLPLSLWATS